MLDLKLAVDALRKGGIIAYPTEAVFGLGCDPFNPAAVERLLALKQRSDSKGFILIASSWPQLEALTAPIASHLLRTALMSWPGPATWVFPADAQLPPLLKGQHDSIALRVTAHTVASALCRQFGKPLISTSANISGQPPARTAAEVYAQFGDLVDYIIDAQVGDAQKPTTIKDVLTGVVLRP